MADVKKMEKEVIAAEKAREILSHPGIMEALESLQTDIMTEFRQAEEPTPDRLMELWRRCKSIDWLRQKLATTRNRGENAANKLTEAKRGRDRQRNTRGTHPRLLDSQWGRKPT